MDFSHLTVPKLREALKQAGVEVNLISREKVICSIYFITGSFKSQKVCVGGLAE